MAGEIVTVKLEGVAAAISKLRTLPNKIQKRGLVKAVRAGINPLKKASYKNAPRMTGIFRASLDTKIKSFKDGKVQVGLVGQRRERRIDKRTNRHIRAGMKLAGKFGFGRGGIGGRGDTVPIHLVENPTRPHRIPKEGKGPLQLRLPSGYRLVVESVNHPGTKGQHPVERAYDSTNAECLQRFSEKLTTEVDIEAAKIAGGTV